MTGRPRSDQPDWLIPAILASAGVVVAVALVSFFAVGSTPSQGERLAGQLERWTTCLRSEGAPVPFVEPVGEEGFRVTVDDVVLDEPLDFDVFIVAFDLCIDDAPEGVQTIAAAVDGIRSLPFGTDDLEWLGPLLFDLGSSGVLDDFESSARSPGNFPLDEFCAELSDLELLVPDVALELFGFCVSEPDV